MGQNVGFVWKILIFSSVSQQLQVNAISSCEYCYLKTHEGLCGPSNLTNDIDSLIGNLYATIKTADEDLGSPRHYPPDYQPQTEDEFDFIVVGAGSAGSAVANRLSEQTGWKILLLEVGGNPPRNSEIPALSNSLKQTEVDWNYKTEPSEYNCRSYINGSCIWPRGKVLGGTSILNNMVYTRGNQIDYDDWGQPGWSFDEVLPYFKKSEDLRDPILLADKETYVFHGVGGPVKVERWLNSNNSVMQAFIKGIQESGLSYNPDCNGENQLGICPTDGFLEDGRRCSTAKAYLTPARDRSNLKVAKYSLVTKVLISNNTAYGVEFMNSQGTTVQVRATKETIVCGGAINTPQILMLSGIGPKEHLSDMGIPVVQDLPVGENLQDHPQVLAFLTINYDPPENSPLESTFDFLLKRPSSLSNLVGQEFTAFLDILGNDSYPEIQLIARPRIQKNSSDLVKSFARSYGLIEEIEEQLIEINKEGYLIITGMNLLRECSRGRILLKSKDPKVYPRIIPGYLSDRRDVDRFVKIYEFIERLAETPTLNNIGMRVHEIHLSNCDAYQLGTYEYRECYIRQLVTTSYHPASTCPMGTVLDAQLRVRGVDRLRVADASVMPFVISGNTNAPTIMIGEKAADMIKQTWLPC